MGWHDYRFRSSWRTGGDADLVYGVLEAFADYPVWWPEVRRLRVTGADSCEVLCRSLLPYSLAMVLRPVRRDPVHRVLEASIAGDLVGFARWTLQPSGPATAVRFDQEVVVTRRLLRALGRLARPALRANHALMMRHARLGLAAYLAAAGPPAADPRLPVGPLDSVPAPIA